MNKFHTHSYLLKENLISLICVILCLYFSYHVLNGDRGVFRLLTLEKKIETMSHKNTSLEAESSALEKKVVMMRPHSLDKDLLEERVRTTLGYRYDGEVTVFAH